MPLSILTNYPASSPLVQTRPVRCSLLLSTALAVFLAGLGTGTSNAQTQPGSVVSAELVSTFEAEDIQVSAEAAAEGAAIPAAQFGTEAYLLEYLSTDRNGVEATITAQLFLPDEISEPLSYVFGPGTTGLVDRCAASRELTDGIVISNYLTYGSAVAAQGIPVLIPDYLGLSDPERLQPYFSSTDEAHVMLDGARALQNFLAERRPEVEASSVFFGGYSRGGHASLAAADLLNDYAPEVELAGVVGYGSSADLEALMRDWQVAAPYMVFVFSQLYPETVVPSEILVSYYAENLLSEVTENCVDGIQLNFPREPEALFQPAFVEALYGGTLSTAFPGVHDALEANKPGLTGHGVPVMLAQGSNDTVVRLESQNAYVGELCATGATVHYPIYDGVLHDTRWVAFADTLEWIRARAEGEAAPDDCAAQ